MSRSIIILPDDSAKPLLDAISGATSSIRIKMFVFSDPSLFDAVVAAHKRGVKVRVMLNPERRDGEKENDETRSHLKAIGVEVKDSNPHFDLTHEKSMVIDDAVAYIQSLNWETRNLTETRDYAIVTSHKHEVDEVIQCFDADWDRTEFVSGDHSHLIWCTGNGRQRLCHLIDSAKHTLWLQNERYQDPVIIEHVVRAFRRGVKIHVMARPPHKLKKEKLVEGVSGLRILQDLDIPIRKLKHIKLHAKLLFADDRRAIIGSINFAPGSFDSRRELAIEVDDEHITRRLHKTLHEDWGNSTPLDLSDKGLLAELRKTDPNVVEDLGIEDVKHK
ncbi:phospholipase D-like domain-containing protein [Edaphobacter modestus]|uniref:phospholipase D n=1 Tax=Edaphobacter modestus TaxID=388466 RepID=A0A4Q7YWJ3_9BACT|nr:phospholipase D-like domain-containing protein [Edaphobacter modestus]RZU41455.1 phosphatidylserine/phosphatidylglycerophosphate/cardiolipin synthase-like enzyme [Edaphobacter modestus]